MTGNPARGGVTPGLVCAHHHLYSSLARGMPAPPRTPHSFPEILELIWWRVDSALDLEMIHWSAMLGALEALSCGTTAIVDHHESPNAIEGSLDVIAGACAEVGVRVVCAYGVTDRHGPDGARRGIEENRRFLEAGGTALVGIHAAFTCSEETLEAAAALAAEYGIGVHVHVAEDAVDREAASRLRMLSSPNWVLAHGVHLDPGSGLQGTVVHNPRSNLNNAVGYARPARFDQPVALGTDGIGADMLEEFRLAYALDRSTDVTASPERAWSWLAKGWSLVPAAATDRVTWSHPELDTWHLAYTTGVHPVEVEVDGRVVWRDGAPTMVDAAEIRARAAEQAERLFSRL